MATAEVSKPIRATLAGRSSIARRASRAAIYALAIVLAVLFSLPFFWTLASSLKTQSELYTYPPTFLPAEIHPENYASVFTLAPFARFILNTVFVTAVAMIG